MVTIDNFHLANPHSSLVEIYPIVETSVKISKNRKNRGKEIDEILLYDEGINSRVVDQIATLFVRFNDNSGYVNRKINNASVKVFRDIKALFAYLLKEYELILYHQKTFELLKRRIDNLYYKYNGLVIGDREKIPYIEVIYPVVNLSFSYY